MIRIPIDERRKIKTIIIGKPEELADIYGSFLLEDLKLLNHKKLIAVSEYKDGTINYTLLN